MINHGSGMLLCMKSVSNKVKSFAPLVVKKHVCVQEKGLVKHLYKPTFLQEFYSTSVTPASSVIEATCQQKSARQTKHLAVKSANSQLAKNRQSPNSVHLCNSDSNLLPRNSSKASQMFCTHVADQFAYSLGVPCSGTLDDIVLVNSPEQCKTNNVVVRTTEQAPLLYCDLERQMMLLSQSDDGSKGFVVKKEYLSGNPADPPTAEQIEKVRSTLASDLPQFFVKPLTYTIYHPALAFENNIQGKKTKGIYDYAKQAAYFRTVGHLRFIYIKYEVMKITGHPEDGTVRVRWKINIIKFRRLFKFWKIKIWDWSTVYDKMEVWYDGFSTYYVAGDGLVHKHVADRMMPDQDPVLDKKVQKVATATEPLLFEETSSLHILYNPSKNSSGPLQLNGL